MRTIKFRVWNNKTKEWIHGPHKHSDLDGVNILGENILLGNFLGGVSIADLNDIVVLQFTGLVDENKKEIFEGDIFQGYDEMGGELLGQVEFIDGAFCITSRFAPTRLYGWHKAGKVVGNICNNQELLCKK